jgi:hypothetical protein
LAAVAEPVADEGSHEGSLQRLIGVRALALTAMNTTVGAGIFGLPALIAADMGSSAPIGYVVTALLCTPAGTTWLGDTCARGRDCITGICQAPGYCTRLCVDGLCPDGMSCVTAPLSADDGTPIKLCTK